MQSSVKAWPTPLLELVEELGRQRDGIGVLDGGMPAAAHAVRAIGEQLPTSSLGQAILNEPPEVALARPVTQPTLVIDIEVLFTPELSIEPVSHLRRIGRAAPLIAVWPGPIEAGRLSYSRPGRADFFDVACRNLTVLRPVDTLFPDEVPYTLERYPA